MGHERIGPLPKTKQWRRIVEEMASFPTGNAEVADIASETLRCVRNRFVHINEDASVQAVFEFLVGLASVGGVVETPEDWSEFPVDFHQNPSPRRITQALQDWLIETKGSLEYRTLAEYAAADTIAEWYAEHSKQGELFNHPEDVSSIWRNASYGAGFCELSRLFFAHFTERYLRYFLDREASSAIETIHDRERFSEKLADHVETISKHAFETAKITQSFAAGWFNKHATEGRPSQDESKGFLGIAFGKLRDELIHEELKG